ncbi:MULTISPECIES: hypothetical protein [Sphingobium]|uniref:hypothetical protein n=1 Tax=Sphingobium TaxID=165695 RepID=UPI00159C5066|nr:hypothetical protein [Sphingobium sp. 15-1]
MSLAAMPFGVIAIFLISLGSQVVSVSLLPQTNGFANASWTICCVIPFLISLWLIAVMIRQGVALNVIMPLFAASVPLASIAVDYFVYGNALSFSKLALLVGACCAIGVAGSIQ